MKKRFWSLAASVLALALASCSATTLAGTESEKKVAIATGKAQQGKASWYGARFHGRKTASGERYNMNAYSAAHRSHAFGTKICVRNTRNGKGVALRVNDRGPFIRGRVVDVSRVAANRLGMMRSGVVPVRVYVVDKQTKSGSNC